jgi:hypothetical protein
MFTNPFAMIVGGALVSAPILIHLINRITFKRIRWAAMEFLLKSQKRNRRRLIIEQLILLMLRCLLCLLAGLLLAQYVGAIGATSTTGTTHVVWLLDDLSMNDRAPRNQTPGPNCFEVAKQKIRTLAENAVLAPSAQNLILYTASKKEVLFNDRLNEDSIGRLKGILADLKPTALHVDVTDSIDEVKKLLVEAKETKRWLHLVSDFREQDWGRSGTDKLHRTLDEIADTGTQIALIDTAAPSRRSSRSRSPEFHNNLAITDLRAEKRVAPAGSIIPFSFTVENFGTEAIKSIYVEIFRNGKEEPPRLLDAPAPGASITHKFDLLLEGPGAGQRSLYHRITVRLPQADPQAGLKEDNVRHTVIEIREQVPTLIIDGDRDNPDRKKSTDDTRIIRNILEAIKAKQPTEATQVVEKGIEELERPDLEREYATIYLLNVPDLKNPDKKREGKKTADLPLERLKQFVANGGNVVFFTGEKVNEAYYNKILFEESHGLFPVPIKKKMTDRLTKDRLDELRGRAEPKVFVVDSAHDITRELANEQYYMNDLLIAQFTEADERFDWKRPWTKEGDLKELIVLAKLKTLDDGPRKQARNLIDRLPLKDDTYKKFHPLLKKHYDAILKILEDGGSEMHVLTKQMDQMLADPGDPPKGKEARISLVNDFWTLPEMKELKADFVEYREKALYGAPLMLTRKYGKGNVVAFLTSAGTAWSGWPALGGELGGVASRTYPMLIADLQKFLTRGGDAGSRLVGEPVTFDLDPSHYKDEIKRYIQVDEGQADPLRDVGDSPVGLIAEPVRTGRQENGRLKFQFESQAPGVHLFRLFPQGPAGIAPMGGDPKAVPFEERWFAFNVDTKNESNLRRVETDWLARNPIDAPTSRGKKDWFEPDEAQAILREKKSNTSESPWLFLFILIVLLVEQALAVHLSFHLKGGEAATPGPAAARPAARPQRAEAPAGATV